MSVLVTQNFDWDITKRKIVLFISNFHRHTLTEFGLRNMVTALPKDDYVIIVGNDNCSYDFSYLPGVYQFELDTGRMAPRNSAFIRNYVIKRCQSEIFFHKDPEVFVNGDFLSCVVERGGGWKTGYVLNFPSNATREVLLWGTGLVFPYLQAHVNQIPRMSADFLKQDLGNGVYRVIASQYGLCDVQKIHQEILAGKLNASNWVSYAFGIETRILQQLRGYDEEFTNYGFEDSDLFCRLMAMKYPLFPDYRCTSIHLYHPPSVDNQIEEMQQIFIQKQPTQLHRNPEEWGEGE